jgi:hypothetical protein
MSGRIQCTRPASPASGGAARGFGDAPELRASASAAANTRPFRATPAQIVCRSPTAGSSRRAASKVPVTAPAVLAA